MELRSYQKDIAKEIDKRFKGIGREERRFVGVKLPTGGGKSFLFLDQFDKLIDEEKQENVFENSKTVISNAGVKYYAPLTGIIDQTQVRVAEYILLDRYIDLFKQKEQIEELTFENVSKAVDEISSRMISSSKIRGKNKIKEAKEKINEIYLKKANDGQKSEELLKDVLEDALTVLADNIDKLVNTEFPNLEFVCYQKDEDAIDDIELLLSDSNKGKKAPKLVIFDEAHRNKMNNDNETKEDDLEKDSKRTWGEKAKELIRKLPNTRFLAITATPERDADGVDPMLEFADESGYDISELRNKDYLASDMSLVSALEDGLVVKPEVVSFDCMLDKTQEYQEIKDMLRKMMKSSKNTDNLSLGKNYETGKLEARDNYHVVLVDFFKMCQLSGKLDFIKNHIQDIELKEVVEGFISGSYKPELEYYKNLEKVLEIIEEIDEGKSELSQEYEAQRSNEISQIVNEVASDKEYLKHGKFICFTPSSNSKAKTKSIMYEHKEKMKKYLNLNDEDVMITHSNTQVISKNDDKKNLAKFTLKKEKDSLAQVMVAMDKFNEGLHVDGIVGSFMFRQFIDKSGDVQEDEKEDPRITFLQQVGRCIYSINPGQEVKDVPVIFDVACNFMRYNDKLKNIFKVSETQLEFKRLYDECKTASKKKSNAKDIIEEEIPKKNILERIIGIMGALTENGIDISEITRETTWKDIEEKIPEGKKEEILDAIFVMTRKPIKPDYPIGVRISSAREAFWHTVRENPKTKSTKKLYNDKTDEFFKTVSFEELYRIGFFNNIDKNNEKINNLGFIVGECANMDEFYGFNIQTGTRFSKGNPERGILGIDIKGFDSKGIHVTTGIRYDTKFFRFNSKTNSWKNLFTGKDEDLLGYNHDGIRVNSAKGKVGFDRDGLWHPKREDGSYSKIASLYDDQGYDAYGFDKQNKNREGLEFINGFYRIRGATGNRYKHRNGTFYDDNGFDIDGFNEQGFNRDGIHRDTGCKYNPSGITIDLNDIKAPRRAFPLKRILEGKLFSNKSKNEKTALAIQMTLTQWIVLSKTYPKAIQNSDWYQSLIVNQYEKETGKNAQEEVSKMSLEIKKLHEILLSQNVEEIKELDSQIQKQKEEKAKLQKEKIENQSAIAKLVSVIKGYSQKKDEEEGPEL